MGLVNNIIKYASRLFNNQAKAVRYIDKGREGYVVYSDEKGGLELYIEFGGSNCLAIIHLPTDNEWAMANRGATSKKEMAEFIAQQVIKDKAPGCHYTISDKWIEIFLAK